MPTTLDQRGVLIFLADWLRSQDFRDWINDPDLTFADVLPVLRERYLLSDEQLGILMERERGRLMAHIVEILFNAKLDFPDPWTGALKAEGAPQTSSPEPVAGSTTSSGSTTAGGPTVGWGGAALVCLEQVSVEEGPAVASVNAPTTIDVFGWYLEPHSKLTFVLSSTDAIQNVPIEFTTDTVGRSTGQVTVTFPKPGSWSISVRGQTTRARLSNAISVTA